MPISRADIPVCLPIFVGKERYGMTTDDEMEAAYEEAYKLNEYWLSLRLFGDAMAQAELAHIVGTAPHEWRNSQGLVIPRNPQIALFRLAVWQDDKNSNDVLLQLVPQIRTWTPALHQLRSSYQCRMEIYISAFRNTDQGGINFPREFVRALADADLSFGISIQARFLWDDEEDA